MKRALLIFVFLSVGAHSAQAFTRSITIDHTKVPSTQTDFPVLFGGTYAYLATVANGGKVESASGYDILFFADSAMTQPLSFERVVWSATTGAVEFWIKVPSVSSSVDTVIYLFYGDACIVSDHSNPPNVWDSNFKGVWHLPNGTSLTTNDSTGNANNGTAVNTPTATTGQVDGAANFVAASNQRITAGNGSISAAYTISMLLQSPNAPGAALNSQPLNAAITSDTYGFSWSHTIAAFRQAFFHKKADTSYVAAQFTTPLLANTFYYAVGTWDGANVRAYLNSTLEATTAAATIFPVSGSLVIGGPAGLPFDGKVDEVRLSNIARSPDWITTEFNNESSPSTFYAVGSETASAFNFDCGQIISLTNMGLPLLFFQHRQIFDTAGTFTWSKPATTTSVFVRVQAPGGGGGGGQGAQGIGDDPGGGGAGGSSGQLVQDFVAVSGDVTVTIGTPGGGGAGSIATAVSAPGQSGANALQTCFGTLCAEGGKGGEGGHLVADAVGGAVVPTPTPGSTGTASDSLPVQFFAIRGERGFQGGQGAKVGTSVQTTGASSTLFPGGATGAQGAAPAIGTGAGGGASTEYGRGGQGGDGGNNVHFDGFPGQDGQGAGSGGGGGGGGATFSTSGTCGVIVPPGIVPCSGADGGSGAAGRVEVYW